MNTYVVHVNDILHNLEVLKEKAGQAQIIGVIKGNGYGFGLKYMASLLKTEGIRMFAVTEISDALTLREDALQEEEILLLRSTCLPEEAQAIVDAGLTATVGSAESAAVLDAAAAAAGKRIRAHIKIDTGMCRYGFPTQEVTEAIAACKACSHIDFTGIYTHFSSAFTKEKQTKAQLSAFKNAVLQIEAAGINATVLHCANTPALFNVPGVTEGMTAVRIGSGFTGRVITRRPSELKRAGILQSRVLEVKKVPKGTLVGYNGLFKTKRDTKLAIIPVGHFDGFGIEKAQDVNTFASMLHSILSAGKRFVTRERLTVVIDGKRYPVAGAVGLSHTAVDITGSDIRPGEAAFFDFSPLFVNPLLKREYLV